MANLSITEFERLSRDVAGNLIPVGHQYSVTVQNVDYTAGSTQSAAFQDSTKFIRVVADTDVRILFGSNPTAVANSSILMASGSAEYFGVAPGEKVAAITAA